MALATLADLRTLIATTINRSDLTAYIDDFISLARVDINARFRVGSQESTAAVTMTAGSPYLALPTNFGELRKFTYSAGTGDTRELTLAPFSPMPNSEASSENGQPKNYAIVGDNFWLTPTPNAAYTGTVWFYLEVPEFDYTTPTDTNWLMTKYPNVYLYGSLLAALPKVGNDVRAPVWNSYYEAAISAITKDDKAKRYAGVPRMRSALYS